MKNQPVVNWNAYIVGGKKEQVTELLPTVKSLVAWLNKEGAGEPKTVPKRGN
jgi:hypothetical protein